jgi:hypothetical protein
VVKALSDTIAPAVDKSDPLAAEQVKLAIGYIEFVRKRLDHLHGRERFDLKHYITLGEGFLQDGLSGDTAAGLTDVLLPAKALVDDPTAGTADLRAAALELGHRVAGVVQAAPDLDSSLAARIRSRVLTASEEKILFERHWYAPMGFDPTPPDEAGLTDFFR